MRDDTVTCVEVGPRSEQEHDRDGDGQVESIERRDFGQRRVQVHDHALLGDRGRRRNRVSVIQDRHRHIGLYRRRHGDSRYRDVLDELHTDLESQ